MQEVQFRNLSGTPDEDLAELREVVTAHQTLEDVLRWAQAQDGYRGAEDFVTQDEFTHDGIFPLRNGNYVVFGLT